MSTKVDVAVYQQAKEGNYYCGDSYFYKESDNEFICAIADGLGSGEYAKESSQIVIDIIQTNSHATVDELVKECNEKLIGKRGVVIGILKFDFVSKMYTYSSIGNIGMMTVTEGRKKKRNIPNSGYLAGYKRPFKVVQGKLEPDMNFIMFSDGVLENELTKNYFINKDVHMIIRTYKYMTKTSAKDDTTLIAMCYRTQKN